MFFGVFVYLIGFLGNFQFLGEFQYLLPKTVDFPKTEPVSTAVIINLLLLALFGGSHSIMARPAFKQVWTRVVPKPIERSTYVLISNLVTILLFWQWRAIDIEVWNVEK